MLNNFQSVSGTFRNTFSKIKKILLAHFFFSFYCLSILLLLITLYTKKKKSPPILNLSYYHRIVLKFNILRILYIIFKGVRNNFFKLFFSRIRRKISQPFHFIGFALFFSILKKTFNSLKKKKNVRWLFFRFCFLFSF